MAKKRTTGRTNRTRKKSTPDWAPRFLAALQRTGIIQAACKTAKVGRRTVYDRRDNDPEFAADLAAALEDACDLLEAEARRRALKGVDKPVVYKGELSGTWVAEDGQIVDAGTVGARFIPLTVKEYSDALMSLLLRAHSEKFRDKHQVEHTGDVKFKVYGFDPTTPSPEEATPSP